MNETDPTFSATNASRGPSHETISRRAQELWEKYGRPTGRDEEIWLEAERSLREPEKVAPAPTTPPAVPSATEQTPIPQATAAPSATVSTSPARAPQKPARASAAPRLPGAGRTRSGAK